MGFADDHAELWSRDVPDPRSRVIRPWRSSGMETLETSALADVPAPAIAPAETIEKSPPRRAISSRLEAVLAVLREAYEYALDLRLDSWDFAVELSTLRPLGLTNSDCRWLIGKGL